MKKMNRPTEVFKQMLDLIEMQLVQYDVGFGLIDLQGVNLRDIESDLFTNAEDIVSRLDAYVNDYYYDDLENESYDQDLFDAFMEVVKETDGGFAVAWNCFAKKWQGDHEVEKFVQDHQHEFNVMDLIANHLDEVNLQEIAEDRTTRREAVIEEIMAELDRRYPNYQLLPRDCIERTLRSLKSEVIKNEKIR